MLLSIRNLLSQKPKIKVALIVSHPIQHFCPQYESFAKNPMADIKVFFASRMGLNPYYDAKFNMDISWNNIRINNFNHVFLNDEPIAGVGSGLDAPRLNIELDLYNPDLVVLYGYFQKFQRRAYRWSLKNRKRVAYISDSEFRKKDFWIKKWTKWPFLRWYFSNINYFLTVGNANESYYDYYGVKSKHFIRMHFPIDIYQYEKAWQEKSTLNSFIRNKYNLSDSDFIACVVGKLIKLKNQDHILDALEQLEIKGKHLVLFIIGSGEMAEELKLKVNKLKANKIFFTGFVNADELPAYYAACNVYIHPAAVDAHSLAVSEAVYMGCPVILSDRCGSYGDSDDVQQGKNGWVYRFGDIGQLASCIEEVIDNTSDRIRYSKYSHKIALEFQQKAHVDSFNELIHMVQKSVF